MMDNFKNNVNKWWNKFSENEDGKAHFDRLKMLVFVFCLILAFCLWLVVNLDRDFNIAIHLPITVGNITSKKALVNKLPDHVTASVRGRGWDLINTYHSPPHVFVDVSGKEINLFSQVRRQLSTNSKITVQKVSPLYLQVNLEKKVSKKVPIRPLVNYQLANQYDTLYSPAIEPDSVTITGAASNVDRINWWPTDSVSFKKVKNNIAQEISLKQPQSFIKLSGKSILYKLRVAQFTEGEVSLPVKTRGFPVGNVVTFSPAKVKIKFHIPLDEFTNLDPAQAFSAYVTQPKIMHDSTGIVRPTVKIVTTLRHLKIVSVQPQEVSYFMILGDNTKSKPQP